MEYRISNKPYGMYRVETPVVKASGFLFWRKTETTWTPVRQDGRACQEGQDYTAYSTLENAQEFLKWCLSDKVVHLEDTFSAPATVVMDGVAIPATANFKVTHVNGEELESYKGDLLEVSVKDDGTAEVTDFIPREVAETDVVAKVAEREITKRTGREPKYDRAQMEQDFREGYSTAEVAARHDVSYPTAAKIKKEMKETVEPVKQPKSFGQPREVGPETNVAGEIRLAFMQGCSLDEVALMYPMVPMHELSKLKDEVRK